MAAVWIPRYLCCWGYTWVPWFFMLSGFILCAAEMNKPRQVPDARRGRPGPARFSVSHGQGVIC